MERKKELLKIIGNAQEELAAIVSREKSIENREYLGKCYKVRNNFSCPENESDYWWLYLKIIETDDRDFYALRFQVDKYGNFTIEPKTITYNPNNYGCIEISEKEFQDAWKELVDELKSIQRIKR
jgi:hypothetical protein